MSERGAGPIPCANAPNMPNQGPQKAPPSAGVASQGHSQGSTRSGLQMPGIFSYARVWSTNQTTMHARLATGCSAARPMNVRPGLSEMKPGSILM